MLYNFLSPFPYALSIWPSQLKTKRTTFSVHITSEKTKITMLVRGRTDIKIKSANTQPRRFHLPFRDCPRALRMGSIRNDIIWLQCIPTISHYLWVSTPPTWQPHLGLSPFTQRWKKSNRFPLKPSGCSLEDYSCKFIWKSWGSHKSKTFPSPWDSYSEYAKG